jgi:hypothetical protein
MINKPIASITLDDLRSLKANEVAEGKTLEYKRELPGDSPEEKRKLLRAVCSLANTAGGDLIYGIDAKDGVPVDLLGIDSTNEDGLRLRLENSSRDGIQPRLPLVHLHFVPVSEGQSILVIRVQKSWNAPHRVGNDGHFYGRNSAGSYQLDIDEVRRAFTLSEAVTERIRAFRAERLIRIAAGETPVPIVDRGTMVLHLVPLAAFTATSGERLSFTSQEKSAFSPLGCQGWSTNVNLDGFVLFTDRGTKSSAYTQYFRSGVVESVAAFDPWRDELWLSSTWIEQQVMAALTSSVPALVTKEVEPPFYVFLSFLKVRGYGLHIGDRFSGNDHVLADRDNLILPEVVIEQAQFEASTTMRPAFDMLWNAFGYERCFHYDEQGKWSGR